MKRLIFIPLILLLFSVALAGGVVGHNHYVHKVATGAVARSDMRLCLLANTSYVDFSAANKLTNYSNFKVVISDSAGKKLTGYPLSSGAGIALGSELATGWTNGATAFETFTATGTSIDSAIESTGGGRCLTNQLGVASGTLLKVAFNFTLNSGSSPALLLCCANDGTGAAVNTGGGLSNGQHYWYVTVPTTANRDYIGFRVDSGASNFTVTGFSVKKFLSPASTGVSITSASGGPTQSWLSEESGFNRNDVSNYTYGIYTN